MEGRKKTFATRQNKPLSFHFAGLLSFKHEGRYQKVKRSACAATLRTLDFLMTAPKKESPRGKRYNPL